MGIRSPAVRQASSYSLPLNPVRSRRLHTAASVPSRNPCNLYSQLPHVSREVMYEGRLGQCFKVPQFVRN